MEVSQCDCTYSFNAQPSCCANRTQGFCGGLTAVDPLEVDEVEGGGQSGEGDNRA